MKAPGPKWRALELGGVVETDVSRHTFLAGASARAEFQAGRPGRLNYRLRNDVTWFAYTGDVDDSVLSVRYNMVHEVLFPLFDELSLSVAADGFLFRGAATIANARSAPARSPSAASVLAAIHMQLSLSGARLATTARAPAASPRCARASPSIATEEA